MAVEVMKYIEQQLFEYGFERIKLPKNKDGKVFQVAYKLGDNYFEKTKRFARFSVIKTNGKFNIAAMTATAIKGNKDRVSMIDWAESAKVSSADFDSKVMKIYKNLIKQVTK